MKTKKLTAWLCTLTFVCSTAAGAFAVENADWPQFMGSPASPGITSAKTPVSAAEAKQEWTARYTVTSEFNGSKYENNACGTPITVGKFVYFTVSTGKLLKVDAKTGKTAASAEVAGVPPYFSEIAYGDGKIFVPQQTKTGVKISAFNSDTLSLSWQSPEIAHGDVPQQISSPITYYNNHIYFGTYTQDSATYAYTSGVFACVDTKTGQITWQQANDKAGYYWNGSAVLGSAIAVSDTNGNIVSYGLTDGNVMSTVSAGGPVSSTLCYAQGRLYAAVNSGYIYAVKADASGKIDAGTAVKSQMLGNSITSSPVVYNDRLYVAGSGYGSTTPFTVLDASTLKTIYQIKIHSQSTPLVSTAYSKDDGKVLIYVTDYGTANQDGTFEKGSSSVYVIEDKPGQTKGSYQTLFTPSVSQSSSQSLTPSQDGMLFYFNDSGTMYAIGKNAPLASPKTGKIPAVYGVGILLVSGAVILILVKRIRQTA